LSGIMAAFTLDFQMARVSAPSRLDRRAATSSANCDRWRCGKVTANSERRAFYLAIFNP
jgi:hypothetical protein